jgi:hypothetical protein
MRARFLIPVGTAVGVGLLFRRWRQKRQALRAAQARGDRVEVVTRLRTLTERSPGNSRDSSDAYG